MCKKLICIVLMLGSLACNKPSTVPACESQVCTLEFRSVSVKFVNKQGQPVIVENYKAINTRTDKPVKGAQANDVVNFPGYYTVINDSSVRELSAEGDDIRVSATKPGAQQTVSALVKVSGGNCACHIQKKSGPEQVMFME